MYQQQLGLRYLGLKKYSFPTQFRK